MATITTRVDDQTKKRFQELTEDLGITPSTLIHMRVKEFLRMPKIAIELTEQQDKYEYVFDEPEDPQLLLDAIE